MQVDEKLLSKLESLSALKIQPENRASCIAALSEVLEFANILQEINTQNVQDSNAEFTPLREDCARRCDIAEQVLAHAPARDGEYFSVPKIIE